MNSRDTSDGLQAERTRLAWSRTALSFVALGGLLLHTGRSGQGAIGDVPGALVIVYGVLLYIVGRLRYRQVRKALTGGRPVTAPAALGVAGLFGTVTALVALATVVAQ